MSLWLLLLNDGGAALLPARNRLHSSLSLLAVHTPHKQEECAGLTKALAG